MMTAMKVFRSSLIMEISNVLVKDDQNCGRLNSFWKFASPVNSSGFAICWVDTGRRQAKCQTSAGNGNDECHKTGRNIT